MKCLPFKGRGGVATHKTDVATNKEPRCVSGPTRCEEGYDSLPFDIAHGPEPAEGPRRRYDEAARWRGG